MKTLYMVWAIIFKGVSVLRTDDGLDGKNILWNAHNLPQDGYGGHNGEWATGNTPQEAVWSLKI